MVFIYLMWTTLQTKQVPKVCFTVKQPEMLKEGWGRTHLHSVVGVACTL